ALNVARLRSCTPTRKRLAQRMLENDLENLRPFWAEWVKSTLEQHEDPEKLIDGLLDPRIKILIKKELGHALAIQNIVCVGYALVISDWSILENNTSKPFITSDNPAILIDFVPHHPYPTYIPLTPRHAILIHVNPKNPHINDLSDLLERRDIITDELSEKMTEFSKDRVIQNFTARKKAVEMLNCGIVKAAEDKIIANIEAEWIKEMVKEYKDWRVESLNTKVSAETHSTIFHHAERAIPTNSQIKILL
ncbi:MAG: DUF4238 domain-containing protein, partial [Alphaproteobacteria bacterium]|nr:DUF4238 domain-containing protein [Alphaproteobacteria bacterium]